MDPEPANLASTEQSPATAKKKASAIHPLTDRIFQPVRLAKIACLVGLSVMLPYLVQRLPNLNSRPEYRLDAKNISIVPEPKSPVPVDLVEQIRRQNQLPRDMSILNPKLCKTIAVAFSRHPWIARVNSVRQLYPASVIIDVEFRKPVAMVQVKGGRIPIDSSGFVLPSEDFKVDDVARYPLIRMEGGGNLTRDRGRVTEPGLSGAAQVAELLADKWSKLELDAIEIPKHQESTRNSNDVVLHLHSKTGSTIIWGRAPGTDHPGELTASQKVARMEKYVAEFGGFDRPSGPYEIDIRHWQEITRRPAAKTQASGRKETRTRR